MTPLAIHTEATTKAFLQMHIKLDVECMERVCLIVYYLHSSLCRPFCTVNEKYIILCVLFTFLSQSLYLIKRKNKGVSSK